MGRRVRREVGRWRAAPWFDPCHTPSGWSAAEAAEEERKTANGSTSLVAELIKCSRSASTTSEGDCGSVSVLALGCQSRR